MLNMTFAVACPPTQQMQALTEDQWQMLHASCSAAQGVPFDLVLVYNSGADVYQAFLSVSAQIYQNALALLDSGELFSRSPGEDQQAPHTSPEPEPL